ncbi:hypothetical protein, partial [Parasutterella excrementihominis]|uniref:hypothetical protein n=1 Tax=Parasutterella excrementihominis TaxID=487175 RepID=UPI00272B7378
GYDGNLNGIEQPDKKGFEISFRRTKGDERLTYFKTCLFMKKGETGMDISSREIGRNIKDEAAENDGEDNKNGRLPNKCLALSARFSSVPSGVTVRVIHYLY